MTERPRRGLTIFDEADGVPLHETEMMAMPTFVTDTPEDLNDWYRSRGQEVTVLHREADHGMSLVRARFAAGYVLPRHSHSVDCLYYVVSGTAVMGNRTVHAGSGFYVPADAPYAYAAGPDGVEVLEFRQTEPFDMKITESPAGWEHVLDAVHTHQDEWRAAATRG